jgi:hypothetical protein
MPAIALLLWSASQVEGFFAARSPVEAEKAARGFLTGRGATALPEEVPAAENGKK